MTLLRPQPIQYTLLYRTCSDMEAKLTLGFAADILKVINSSFSSIVWLKKRYTKSKHSVS